MKILVNIITTLRFVYTLFLPLLKAKISRTAFIINIVVLFLSDSIDGFLARKFKVQTMYGALMDTIADKALCIILLALLTERIDTIFVMIILELMIALINVIGMIQGKNTKSRIIGKTKMNVISIAIVLIYLYCFEIVNRTVAMASIYITIFVQMITVIDYVLAIKSQKPQYQTVLQAKNIQDLKYILFNTEYYLNSL